MVLAQRCWGTLTNRGVVGLRSLSSLCGQAVAHDPIPGYGFDLCRRSAHDYRGSWARFKLWATRRWMNTAGAVALRTNRGPTHRFYYG